MKKEKHHSESVVYQTKTGAIGLSHDMTVNTVWATQADIAEIFNINVLPLRNIYAIY